MYADSDQLMLHHGDLFDVLPMLDAESIDACITDPPYDLTANKRGGTGEASLNLNSPAGRSRISTGGGFMGKEWDGTGVAFKVETWREVYRVLKPGAHLLACGGTRTYHRMVVAIEDAGFEIRDCLCWLYGSGFPKSLNISRAIDALIMTGGSNSIGMKAANAFRPGEGRVRASTRNDGILGETGGEKITRDEPMTDAAKQWDGWGTALKPAFEPIVLARKPFKGTIAPNVLTHGTGALHIDACRIATDDNLNGGRYSAHGEGEADGSTYGSGINLRTPGAYEQPTGRWPANVVLDEAAAGLLDAQSGEAGGGFGIRGGREGGLAYGFGATGETVGYGDTGGASRFFYVAKPSREERDYGHYGTARNGHPTVKPVELMRWLVRLITPPGGTVLDPFMGSGTTGMACRYELRQFIGIELEAEYVAIAERRIANCVPLFAGQDDEIGVKEIEP